MGAHVLVPTVSNNSQGANNKQGKKTKEETLKQERKRKRKEGQGGLTFTLSSPNLKVDDKVYYAVYPRVLDLGTPPSGADLRRAWVVSGAMPVAKPPSTSPPRGATPPPPHRPDGVRAP